MAKADTMEQKIAKVEAKMEAKAEAAAVIRTTSGRARRAERTSFNGTEAKLRIGNQIEGYHLHILNDVPGRIDQALQAGYEFVSPDEVGGVANNVVSRNTDLGDKVRFLVGQGSNNEPMYAYLMKIESDLYAEDQQALQAKNNRIDDAIRGGKPVDGQPSDGTYVPREGIKMSRS